MNLLALDTSSALCSVSLGDRHRITEDDRAHAAMVAPFLEELLSASERPPDGVVVVAGPGSYTGLRIGVSSAKGLCVALDIPLYAVSSLTTAVAAAPTSGDSLVAVERARRGELYVGAPGRLADTVIDDASLPAWLESVPGGVSGIVSRDPDRLGIVQDVLRVTPTALHARDVVRKSPDTYLVPDTDTFEPYYLKAFVARAATGSVFDRLATGGT